MLEICDVLLCLGEAEVRRDDGVATLNAWLERQGEPLLAQVMGEHGAQVYAGRLRRTIMQDFIGLVALQPWRKPGLVQVLVRERAHHGFRLLNGVRAVLAARCGLAAKRVDWWRVHD